MLDYLKGQLAVAGVALLLTACASLPPAQKPYRSDLNNELYEVKSWQLVGRLAAVSPGAGESWSAGLEWRHLPRSEKLKLSGPLGQGAIAVELTEQGVVIDRGGGDVQTSTEPEQFISRHIGLDVPLQSLRFWVLGLPEANSDYQVTVDGFVQDGWLITYKEMQQYKSYPLPRKMVISKNKMRLKLIIDQWALNDSTFN